MKTNHVVRAGRTGVVDVGDNAMRKTLTSALAAALAVSMWAFGDHAAAPADLRPGFTPPAAVADPIPGQWVVELAPGVEPGAVAGPLAAGYGGRTMHVYRSVIAGFSFLGTDDQAERLASDPRVRSVEPDVVVRAADHDSVSWQRFQRILRVPPAYHHGARGQGARVAVLDTGVADHPAIPRVDRQRGRACVESGTSDSNGHGTATAGNVVSVAPEATIIPIKVLNRDGAGSVSNLICGIDHVTLLNSRPNRLMHVHVANMSLTLNGTCANTSALCQALTRSTDRGGVYVAAAGNGSENAAGVLPAVHPHAIAVSALEGTDRLASFSNFGAVVEAIAPGVNIRSPAPGGGFTHRTGTSRSSPLVAGVAAMVRSLQPTWKPSRVKQVLLGTGQCPDGQNVNSNLRCGGRWVGDPDRITEPLPNTRRASRAAARIPSVFIHRPQTGATLSDREAFVAIARDEAHDGTDATADLVVRYLLRDLQDVSDVVADGLLSLRRDLTLGGWFATGFDSTQVPDGTYRLVLVARDADGNRVRDVTRVHVQN